MRPRTTTYMCVNSSTEVCWFYLSSGRAPPIYAPSHYYIAYICVLILLPNAAENTCSKCGGSTSLAARRAYGERRSQACQYLYFCTSKASKEQVNL
jgi:hypothetical protein